MGEKNMIFNVGDRVKVLRKKGTYVDARVFPGIVLSFDEFDDTPCATIAYYENDYNASPSINFLYYIKDEDNSSYSRKEYDVVLASDNEIKIDGKDVIDSFEKQIKKLEKEISDLRAKEEFFKKHFMSEE